MAKYRLLTADELKQFEDDFIKYLVVNGVTAEEWIDLKENHPDAAQQITDLFSDVVFEQVLRKIDFIELITPGIIQGIHCQKEKMLLVAIKTDDESIDLSQTPFSELDPDKIEIYKGEKSYKKGRQEDIYEMLEQGFSPSDGKLYKQLMLATVE